MKLQRVLNLKMYGEDVKFLQTKLKELSVKNPKIKVFEETVDWTYKYFGVYDGQTKTVSRSKCSGNVLVQFDSDEVLSKEDALRFNHRNRRCTCDASTESPP